MDRFPLPWRALREVLAGDLRPGLHAITGPIGSGKTQLALQIAAHGAGLGRSVALSLPRTDPKQLRARVEGVRARIAWSELEGPPPPLPDTIELAEGLPHGDHLIVIDPFDPLDPIKPFDPLEPSRVDRARRAALDRGTALLLVVDPLSPESVTGFVPPEILRRSPGEIAAWIGVSPQLAAEVDTLLVLAPDRPRTSHGWMTIEVLVAKHRHGLPGRAPLLFNGSWFEDEAEDLDLGIETPSPEPGAERPG